MNLICREKYTLVYADIEYEYSFYSTETIEEKIIRIIRNFEYTFGISFGEFESKYKQVIYNFPDKFI